LRLALKDSPMPSILCCAAEENESEAESRLDSKKEKKDSEETDHLEKLDKMSKEEMKKFVEKIKEDAKKEMRREVALENDKRDFDSILEKIENTKYGDSQKPTLKVIIIGQPGVGKSCLANLSRLIIFYGTHKSKALKTWPKTLPLAEERNSPNEICTRTLDDYQIHTRAGAATSNYICDSRGIPDDAQSALDELERVCKGKVKDGKEVQYDRMALTRALSKFVDALSSLFVPEKIEQFMHGVVVAIPASSVENEEDRKGVVNTYKTFINTLQQLELQPIVAITQLDKSNIFNDKERDEKISKLCDTLKKELSVIAAYAVYDPRKATKRSSSISLSNALNVLKLVHSALEQAKQSKVSLSSQPPRTIQAKFARILLHLKQ